MKPISTSGGGLAGGSQPAKDWTVEVADRIESAVTSVRDKTVEPLTTVARGLVYGLLAGVLAIVLLIMMVIIVVRLADVYAFDRHSQTGGPHVWAVDVIVGGMLVLGGWLAWRKRRPQANPDA